jgi:hypothetical protein
MKLKTVYLHRKIPAPVPNGAWTEAFVASPALELEVVGELLCIRGIAPDGTLTTRITPTSNLSYGDTLPEESSKKGPHK